MKSIINEIHRVSLLQAWLLALVVLPARSHIFVRFALVAFLALLSILMQPRQVWVVSLFLCLYSESSSDSIVSFIP